VFLRNAEGTRGARPASTVPATTRSTGSSRSRSPHSARASA